MKHHIKFYTGFGLNTRQTTITINSAGFRSTEMVALYAVHAACAALAVQPRELRVDPVSFGANIDARIEQQRAYGRQFDRALVDYIPRAFTRPLPPVNRGIR